MKAFRILLVCVLLLLLPSLCFAGQQTSGVTAATLIDRAQYVLADANGKFHDDTTLLVFLNMGIHDLAAKTRCNESVYAVALESGISEYSLNSTDYITINTALYYSGTTIYKGLKRGNPQSTGHVSSPKEPMFWYQTGNRIGFYPIPTASISGCSVFVYLTERLSSIAPTDTIPTPAIYDNALVYFVVAQGAYRDVQKTMGDAYMVMYHDILKLFRGDFEERPVEAPKEIIK